MTYCHPELEKIAALFREVRETIFNGDNNFFADTNVKALETGIHHSLIEKILACYQHIETIELPKSQIKRRKVLSLLSGLSELERIYQSSPKDEDQLIRMLAFSKTAHSSP